MEYFTFGDEPLAAGLAALHGALARTSATVGELFCLLLTEVGALEPRLPAGGAHDSRPVLEGSLLRQLRVAVEQRLIRR